MIVVVGGTKGGTGKTTLVTNLAVVDACVGVDTFLLDTDRQGSASAWAAARESSEQMLARVPTMQKFGGKALTAELKSLSTKYKNIFVDAGGYDSEELRASIIVADVLLVPLRPAQLDIWALPRVFEIIAQAQSFNPNLKPFFVINAAPAQSHKEIENILALTNEVEGMVFTVQLLSEPHSGERKTSFMKPLFTILSSLLVALMVAVPGVATAADPFPQIILLPDGFQPEGVVVGRGHEIFAGSLATGAIYRADLRTGAGGLVVQPQPGRLAVGLSYDERSNAIFVAGGGTGFGYVYDAASGASLAAYPFATAPTFVNDVVVTQSAAYFTDSQRSFLYHVPLGPGGQLPDAGAVEEIPLSGDYAPGPGFNVNGIDATPDGKSLIIVQSGTGTLYHVDPATGVATRIDLGGATVPNGDGILLDGKTLYVVQNRLNQIAVIRLNPQLTAGEVVTYITDSNFRVPTTIAEFGDRLYVVNARFGTPPTPTTDYDIVQVPKQT